MPVQRPFRQKIFELTEEAVAGLPANPTLIAFPELIGFPLLLTLENTAKTLENTAKTLAETIKKALTGSWQEILKGAWQHKYLGLSLMYLPSALPAYRAYTAAFSDAAKTFGVTIVAGSSLLPYISYEPSLGLHIADPRVYNTALTFGPNGRLLGQTHKVHLTKGLESRMGITRGRLQDLQVLHTPVGMVGIAICLDAFHDSVIGYLDGLGAELIVQPSANNALWSRPWPKDKTLTEGEAWFRYGFQNTLLGTHHVRYGVNPMLVGDMWELRFEGVSSIVEVKPDQVTVLSQAKDIKQALVRATVDISSKTK